MLCVLDNAFFLPIKTVCVCTIAFNVRSSKHMFGMLVIIYLAFKGKESRSKWKEWQPDL